ncbi:transposase [uncultured Draconibacterium sp.]|uniref:transposase n=1 Tax=uncultured Draconibacterium sp. TaxID=1573823 RepID=UPI0026086450|nr:transposase [uncultured Draconibacterium sp.]
MDKFNNTFRIESHRLRGYDYSGDGMYFVTLVIQGRDCILGTVKDEEVILSEFGKLIKEEWLKSFSIRKELFLDEFIIMPNHLHGLLIIKNNYDQTEEMHGSNVQTQGLASLEKNIRWQSEPVDIEFKRKPKSLSSFVAGFKSGSTNAIDNYIDLKHLDIPKYNRDNKLWQASYHDRIIRNEREYWKIKNYIKSNPKNWEMDDMYR